jgi:hypothetical protein
MEGAMDKVDILYDQFFRELGRIEANRQGHHLAELTTLSFLIDRQIALVECVALFLQPM